MSELETIHRNIAAALAEATEHELQAREARRLAGQLLIRARAEARTDEPWLPPGMGPAQRRAFDRAGGRREGTASNLAALQCRYGSPQQHRGISASPSRDDRGNPTSRAQPGDTVSVTNHVFTVESFDGALYTLRFEHGVMLHAGVLAVRKAEHGELA